MAFEWLRVEKNDEIWFSDYCLYQWFEKGENLLGTTNWDEIPPLNSPWVHIASEDDIREFADHVLSLPGFDAKLLFVLSTVFINPAKTTALTDQQLKRYQEIFFQTLAQNHILLELTFVDILWKYVAEEVNEDIDFRRSLAELCFSNVNSNLTTSKFNKSMYLFWSRHLIASPSLETPNQMQKIYIFSLVYQQTQKRFPRFWCLFPYSFNYLRLMEPLNEDENFSEDRQYELMWRLRSGDDQKQNYYYLFVQKTNNELIKKCLHINSRNNDNSTQETKRIKTC